MKGLAGDSASLLSGSMGLVSFCLNERLANETFSLSLSLLASPLVEPDS